MSIAEAIAYLTWVADLVIEDPEGLILVDDEKLRESANVLSEYRANVFPS